MIDIIEQDLINISGKLFDTLIKDKTTQKNICWATDYYTNKGTSYFPQEPITKNLIIKAGQNESGINDKIWIGKAVVEAAHLLDIANRNGVSSIALSPLFYNNVIELLCEANPNYKYWINEQRKEYYGSVDYYACNIVKTRFDEWIEENI